MKRLLTALALLAVVGTASAQWHHHGYYGHRGGYYGGGNWAAPLIIGGVIGYELNRPQVIVEQQPPVYVQNPPVYIQQPPAGYHWQQMVDPQTNTTKIVLVPN